MPWVQLPGTQCPLLETPQPAPRRDAGHQHAAAISSKILSAQEASQRHRAALPALPGLTYRLEEVRMPVGRAALKVGQF